MSKENRTPTYTSYRKKANSQRNLLLALAIWNGIASGALILNIIHHW